MDDSGHEDAIAAAIKGSFWELSTVPSQVAEEEPTPSFTTKDESDDPLARRWWATMPRSSLLAHSCRPSAARP